MKKTKYTAADFAHYHSGKMSDSEMHVIERAALEDPFLAEALEGYAYATTPVKDIDELKEKLLQRKKKKNLLLRLSDNKWLRIAALFILISGVGYFAYLFSIPKNDNLLATKRVKEIKTESETAPVVNDSSITADKIIVPDSPEKKQNEIAVNKISKTTKKPDTKNADQINSEKSPEFLSDSRLQKAPASESKRDEAIAYKDDNRKDKSKFEDTLKNTAPENRKLDEVVVTAMGVKRQKKDLGYATKISSKAPGIKVEDSVSKPVTSIQKFTEYTQKNIKIPVDAKSENYKGKVVLSFEISKSGNPKKIKVEQALCSACDKEAIRLLKNGPKWKYLNDERNKVSIEF